jgi:hypothetical protein
MNPYIAVLLLLGLMAVGWRFARRRPPSESKERVRRPERKVEGFLVWSPLHVRMGRGCIADHGMQFGVGFRRKEGPLLPHDPNCRCETVAFTFTGSEVFGGALRRLGVPKSLEPGFPVAAIAPALAALKRINAEPLPSDADAYLALAGVDAFDEGTRGAVAAFLRERYAFLAAQPRASTAPDPSPGGPEGSEFDSAAAKTP